MCPDTIIWRQEFLRIILSNLLQSFVSNLLQTFFLLKIFSQTLFFKKSNFPACLLMNHLHSFLETVSFRELRLISPRGTFHVLLRRLRNASFLSARPGRRGMAPKVCRAAKQLSVIKSLQTQAVRNSRNRWRVSNMLKKHHHHHRHRHQNHITYHLSSIWQ